MAIYYLFSGAVLAYAFLRISRGLESTYETRKSCVVKHLSVLLAYVGYAVLLLLLYVIYLVSEGDEDDSNSLGDSEVTKTIEYILALLIGCRYAAIALTYLHLFNGLAIFSISNWLLFSFSGEWSMPCSGSGCMCVLVEMDPPALSALVGDFSLWCRHHLSSQVKGRPIDRHRY